MQTGDRNNTGVPRFVFFGRKKRSFQTVASEKGWSPWAAGRIPAGAGSGNERSHAICTRFDLLSAIPEV